VYLALSRKEHAVLSTVYSRHSSLAQCLILHIPISMSEWWNHAGQCKSIHVHIFFCSRRGIFSFLTHGLLLSVQTLRQRTDNRWKKSDAILYEQTLFCQICSGKWQMITASPSQNLTGFMHQIARLDGFREGTFYDMASATNSFARQLHDKLQAQTSHGHNMFSKFCCVIL
jgi:hypothetical protein